MSMHHSLQDKPLWYKHTNLTLHEFGMLDMKLGMVRATNRSGLVWSGAGPWVWRSVFGYISHLA
jgi:hypothetical protein